MKGWLIYRRREAEQNGPYIEFYHRACRRRGADITLCCLEDFSYGTDAGDLFLSHCGKPVSQPPDFVVMRADEPLFSWQLEKLGYRVFNNAHLSFVANDKEKTLLLAAAAGIATPVSRFVIRREAIQEARQLGFPLVLKPRDGHGGQDVLFVQNEEALSEMLKTYPHQRFLLQKPVSELGRDLRVYVVGGKIVASMLRCQDRDFRSNYCLGGTAQRYLLSSEEEKLVGRVVSLLEIGFAGIDFMFDRGTMLLNEIEDVVGARMLYHHTDIDVVDLYMEHILKHIS